MRLLTPDNAPSHIAFASSLAEAERINAPKVNLVIVPLSPSIAFKKFAKDALANDVTYFTFKSYDNDADLGELPENLQETYGQLSGFAEVAPIIKSTAAALCFVTQATSLFITQQHHTHSLKTMRPHVDRNPVVRALLDLSPLGMACFDQTGLSVDERLTISKSCLYSENFDRSEQAYAELANRLLLTPGHVALFFKGKASQNPLLHATIPLEMRTPEQKNMEYRPCWRMDTYF